MQHAFILGGTGQIGHAVADRLLAQGWRVTLASRSPQIALDGQPNLRHIALDRRAPGAIALALGDGADLLLDCIAFNSADARQLVDVQDSVGTICAISSASVFRDDAGRTLDEALSNGFPEMPVPITASQPTVDPGDATYSTRKVAMERTLLDHCQIPVTILRPSAIYGPYCSHAREWFFVKRLLDGRQAIPVAYGGLSRFQTSSVQGIANAVLASASKTASTVINVADPVAPTVIEIGEAIMHAMGVKADIVGLPDCGYPPKAGVTPWSIPKPFVVAPSDNLESTGRYESLVPPAVHWLIEATRGQPWQEVLPALAAYPFDLFDYTADERALRTVK
ncbi:MAG: NAD-dependent epimerase/dehydratase family protein [Sphingomonas sp.]|nr:NAD-dependent epimerase/dehydratase family protein [Sphingomonas sp.]